MIPSFRRARKPKIDRETMLSREVDEVELELAILRRFINAAPKMQEESRYLVPPPDEWPAATPPTPSRVELKRIQREGWLHAIRLVFFLFIFFFASVWFMDRLLTVMR